MGSELLDGPVEIEAIPLIIVLDAPSSVIRSAASSEARKLARERAGAQIRRRRRPGLTAAPTTAALATGEGPGVTALVTTAALATGARTTPTRPRRPGPNGMSGSF